MRFTFTLFAFSVFIFHADAQIHLRSWYSTQTLSYNVNEKGKVEILHEKGNMYDCPQVEDYYLSPYILVNDTRSRKQQLRDSIKAVLNRDTLEEETFEPFQRPLVPPYFFAPVSLDFPFHNILFTTIAPRALGGAKYSMPPPDTKKIYHTTGQKNLLFGLYYDHSYYTPPPPEWTYLDWRVDINRHYTWAEYGEFTMNGNDTLRQKYYTQDYSYTNKGKVASIIAQYFEGCEWEPNDYVPASGYFSLIFKYDAKERLRFILLMDGKLKDVAMEQCEKLLAQISSGKQGDLELDLSLPNDTLEKFHHRVPGFVAYEYEKNRISTGTFLYEAKVSGYTDSVLYDKKGNVTRLARYYTGDILPWNAIDFIYDEKGKVVQTREADWSDGEPTADDFFERWYTYDEKGRLSKIYFYDEGQEKRVLERKY